jgi:hypothetical protein
VLAGVLATGALFTLVILELFEDKYFPDQREDDRKQAEQGEVIRIVVDQNGRPVTSVRTPASTSSEAETK